MGLLRVEAEWELWKNKNMDKASKKGNKRKVKDTKRQTKWKSWEVKG